MSLTPEVRTYLTKVGMNDEQLTSIEKEMDKSQKDAEAEGIERKDAGNDAATSDDGQSNEKNEKQTSPAFSEAQTVELTAVFKSFAENMNKELVTVLSPIIESLKELKEVEKEEETEEERLKQIVKLSSPKTLEALLFGDEGRGQSASSSDDTIIKGGGRSKEGKDGPKENKEEDRKLIINTGDPFKDNLVAGLFDEKELAGIN